MCLLKCLATLIGIDAAMVVAIHQYRRYSASYSRYRRRRSGTSSTATSRGRIRVPRPSPASVVHQRPRQLFGLRGRDFFALGASSCW